MTSTTVKKCIVFAYLIAVLLCAQGLANLPGSLQHDIMYEFDINISQYGLLFSVLNWAALIDIIHGYLLDRYLDIRTASIIYSAVLLIGTIFVCISAFTKQFWLLLLGRILSGLGTNPIVLCTNKHIIYWFSGGKYINLIYSMNESMIWLGSSAVYFISIRVLSYVREYYSPSKSMAITLTSESAVLGFLLILSANILALLYGKTTPPDKADESCKESERESSRHQENNLTWKDYASLSWLFWIFALTIFIYFISIFSFLSMSQLYFKTKYKVSTSYASTLSGSITVLPFALSPPFGLFLDRFGQNLTCLTLAFLLNILSHSLFAYTNISAVVPVCVMAVSIVLSSSLWSQFQYLVEEHQQMIAYGVAQTGLNGALAVGTVIAGYVINRSGYDGFMEYLVILIICTLPNLIVIWYLNYKRGNILNLKPKEKLQYLGRSNYFQNVSDK